MSDLVVVALAVAAAVGAWLRPSLPVVLAVIIGIAGLVTARRSAAFSIAAVFVVSGTLGARAWDGLTPPVAPGTELSGMAAIVADPVAQLGGTTVDLRIDGMRLRASAALDGPRLDRALAGERWHVRGRYSPLDRISRVRLASRHLAGRLKLVEARPLDGGTPVARVANRFRAVLLRGTGSMSPDRRALFSGVVLGDDREQNPTEVEDFRASGLTHLLAVSGQNVAFALAVAAPIVRRLRLGGRLAAGAGVLVVFGTVTRWEPSVTRAIAMAGVTLLATTLGRQASPVRVLALAVLGLVLIDPLLVHSIGFALSVAACGGLAVIAPVLRRRIPEPLAVTAAAQAAVLPVMLPLFGPVPLVALPANLLAAPVAGPLMMWGIAGGFAAGLAGEPVAAALHAPSRAMLWWLSAVARWSASLRLPWVTPKGAVVAALVVLAACAVVGGARALRRPLPRLARTLAIGAGIAASAACLVLVVWPRPVMGEPLDTGAGDRLWRARGATVVTTDARAVPGRLLAALRTRGVTDIDVLVVTGSGRTAWRSLTPVRDRIPIALILAPANHQIADAVSVETPVTVTSGPLVVDVAPDGKGLRVRIGSPRAPRARVPELRHHDARPRHGHPQPHARLVLRQGRLLPVRRLPAPR